MRYNWPPTQYIRHSSQTDLTYSHQFVEMGLFMRSLVFLMVAAFLVSSIQALGGKFDNFK